MLQIVLWGGVLLRVLAAIWNSFYIPISFTKLDATGFQFYASKYSNNLVLSEFFDGAMSSVYHRTLGIIYYLTTDSWFLGCIVSVLVWLVSAFILIRTMRLLEIERRCQIQAMLIFALLPSVILFTSTTLREAFELMFVNLAMYSSLKIYLKKSRIHLFILPLAVASMSYFHSAFMGFGFVLIASLIILLVFFRRKKLTFLKIQFLAPLVIVPVTLWISLIPTFQYNLSEDIAAVYNLFINGLVHMGGRALYRDFISYSGTWDIISIAPVVFFQYMFEPMPWKVSSFADVELVIENIIRFWLILRAVTRINKLPLQRRNSVMLVFIFYLVLEGIWSLGTANWGTAARHHVSSIGLLVIAAFAYGRSSTSPLNAYGRYRYS